MKKYSLIIIILFFFSGNLFSQNRLQNGGFEKGNKEKAKENHAAIAFDDYIDNWKSRMKVSSSSNCKVADIYDGKAYWHSPDWYIHDYYYSRTGVGSVGIKGHELIQQKFERSNKLESEKYYLITLYVEPQNLNSIKNGLLRFYLGKKEMKYQKERGKCKDICSYKYRHFKDDDVKMIHEIDLAVLDKEDEYTKLQFIFKSPEAGFWVNDYNWFGLQMVNKPTETGCWGFADLYIDDISIEETEYCSLDSCANTEGEINYTIRGQYPFFLDNLDNVTSIRNIEIYGDGGKFIAGGEDVYSINGITEPVYYWDGKTSTGASASAANYLLKITVENDCYVYQDNFLIYWGNPYPSTMDPLWEDLPEPTVYNNSVETPYPCCEYEPDIYLNDIEIDGEGRVEFIAMNNIYGTGSVHVGSDVKDLYFQAGNDIDLGSDFNAEPGSEIIFHSGKSCTPGSKFDKNNKKSLKSMRINAKPLTRNELKGQIDSIAAQKGISRDSLLSLYLGDYYSDAEIAEVDEEKDKKAANISDNEELIFNDKNVIYQVSPSISSDGMITVTSSSNEIFDIFVFDVNGNQVYQKINLQCEANLNLTLNSGIYFIKICSGTYEHSEKIVIY